MARTRRTRGGGGGRGGRGGGQRIVLQTVAPPLQGPGLNQSLAKLRELNAEVAKFNAGVAGLTGGLGRLVNLPKMRSLESIEQQLRGATKTMATGLKPENVAKVFGLSTQEMERGLADFRAKIQQGQVKLTGGRKARMQDFFGTGESAGEFASMRRAAQFMKDMLDDQRRMAEQIQRTLFPQSQVVRSEPGAATSARRAAESGTPPPPRQPGPALADLTTRLQREQSQLAKVVAARDRLARQMEAAPAGGPPAGTGGPPVLPIAPRLAKADQALAARRARVTELERELAQRAAQEGPRPATPPTPAPDLQERLEREKAQLAKVQAARQRLAAAPPPAPAQQMLLPTQEFRAGAFQPARPDPRMAKVDRAIAQRQSRIAEMEKAAAVSAPAAPVSVQTPAPGAPPAPRMTAPVPNLTAPVPTVPVAAGTMVAMTLRGDQIVATLVPPPIRLEVPGSLIQATVVGPVTAQPAGGGAGGGGMPHRDPTTGQFLPPGGGGGAGGGGGGGGSEEPAGEGGGRRRRRRGREGGVSDADIERLRRLPVTDDELRRVITRTEEDAQIEITRALGPFQKRTEKRSLSGGLRVEKVREEDDRGARLRKEINDRLAAEKAALETRLASYKGVEKTAGSLRGQAAEVRQTQASLQSFIRQRMPAAGDQGPMAEETRAQLGRIQQRVDRMRITANNLDLAAAQAELQAAGIADKEAKKQLQHLLNLSRQRAKTQAKQAQLNAQIAQQQQQVAQAQQQQQMVAAQFAAHQAQANQLMAGGYTQGPSRTKTFTRQQGGGQQQTVTFQPPSGSTGQPNFQWVTQLNAAGQMVGSTMTSIHRPIQQATSLARQFGQSMLMSFRMFAQWHVNATLFWGSLATSIKAFQTAAQVQLQTARLEQIFRGVGGSAQALSMDVIRLAAAEGRSRNEAMESAIAWSRLGSTRREVNEAVRVSLMAANVAELDAAQAGQFLTSIMQAYGQQIMDVNKVLGFFNALTNTSKATNKELFQGLAQTANVAKEAGLSLDTLAAVMAVTIEKSGQTGSRIGTAMKSTIIALSNPEIQKLLRQQYNFEITTKGGSELQDMEQILAKLFILYSNLNDKRKEEILVMIAGKTQANRLAAFLDSYITGLVRAANGQRHLNSAEEESAKIRATLISQWQGLGAAVAGTVVQIDRATGSTKAAAVGLSLLKNIIRLGSQAMEEENPIGRRMPQIPGLVPDQRTFTRRMFGALRGGLQTALSPIPGVPMTTDRLKQLDDWLGRLAGSSDAFARSLEPVRRNLRDAEGRAKSLETTMRLLEIVQKSVAGAAPDQQKFMVEELGKLQTLPNAGQFAADLGAAAAARNQQQIESLTQAQLDVLQKRAGQEVEAAQKQMRAIRSAYEARIKSRPDTATGRAERKELETELAKLNEVAEGSIKPWIDQTIAFEEAAAASLLVKTNLEKVRAALAAVQNLIQQAPAFGITGQLQRDIEALEAQRAILERQIQTNNADPNISGLQRQAIGRKLGEEMESVQAQLSAKRSPLTRDLTREAERQRQIAEISRAQGEAFDFGGSRAARALNRERGLEMLIAFKTKAAALTNDEKNRSDLLAEVEVHRVQLAEARLHKEKERFEVLKDEFEYNRKMLTSGPAELIRKVVAARILQRGTPTGAQFLGYSTEMRQTLMEEMEHRQNQAFLRGSPYGAAMEQWMRPPGWMQAWLQGPAWLRNGLPLLMPPGVLPPASTPATSQPGASAPPPATPAPPPPPTPSSAAPATPAGAAAAAARQRRQRPAVPPAGAHDEAMANRVREHWQRRVREAQAEMEKAQTEQQREYAQGELQRAQQALAEYEGKQKPQAGTQDRVREHWRRRIEQAQAGLDRAQSEREKQDAQGELQRAQQALADYERRQGIKPDRDHPQPPQPQGEPVAEPAPATARPAPAAPVTAPAPITTRPVAQPAPLPQPAPIPARPIPEPTPVPQPVPITARPVSESTPLPQATTGQAGAPGADRQRAEWRKRLRQAMEIPDIKLREEAVRAAEAALAEFERRQGDRGGEVAREREQWRRRLQQAQAISDPKIREDAITSVQEARQRFEGRVWREREQGDTQRARLQEDLRRQQDNQARLQNDVRRAQPRVGGSEGNAETAAQASAAAQALAQFRENAASASAALSQFREELAVTSGQALASFRGQIEEAGAALASLRDPGPVGPPRLAQAHG